MARKSKEQRAADKKLDALIEKINNTKKPSKREERGSGGRVKTYDMGHLVGTTVKAEGKKPTTLAGRINKGIKQRKANNAEQVKRFEAAKVSVLHERPLPDALPVSLAPPLPPREPGSKPNIVAFIYAHRAFMQYAHAFTRRGYTRDEAYYQGLKKRFYKAMQDCDMADLFDWEDF